MAESKEQTASSNPKTGGSLAPRRGPQVVIKNRQKPAHSTPEPNFNGLNRTKILGQ